MPKLMLQKLLGFKNSIMKSSFIALSGPTNSGNQLY